MENKAPAKKTKTKDIATALKKYAIDNNLSLKECDFTINKVDTYMHSTADDDYKLYNEDINHIYEDEDRMVNEHIKLHQVYTITITQLIKSVIKLNYSIKFDQYSVHPKLIITPDSYIPYNSYKPSEILLYLVKEVNKIKAKNNILIKLFDENMIKNLKAFTKHLYSKKFTKKVQISLFNGIDPKIYRTSKLVKWYEEKSLNRQIIEVDANEIIVEYKKAIFGKNGFDSFGEIIKSGSGHNTDDCQADIDEETIKIIENNDKKLYKSKVKGFVNFSNNILRIDNKIRMRKLSRIESIVAKDEDNNIEVHIEQHDTNTDSIGEGVQLQSEVIHVTGHVGAKSVLEALNLQIDGATHQSSVQYAKDAEINRHKGTLRSNTAKIKLLEGGEVHASKVEIEVALGGSIHAEDVTINQVKNHVKVYASNSINIKSVTGEDNIFKINYRDVPVLTNKLSYLDKEIQELKLELESASKHTKSQIPILKQKIKDIRHIQDKIRDTAKYAKISIEKPLKGLNTIIFTLNTGDEIVYKTDAVMYKPFYIDVNNDKLTLHPVNKTISLK